MHVGSENPFCPDLYIDKRKLEKVNSMSCSVMDYADMEDGEHKMESSKHERYLGMIISKEGNNKANIQARVSKGLGAISEIMPILDETFYGPYYFEMFTTLRNALFINSVLSNCAAWYNLKKEDIRRLENCEAMLMKRGLATNEKTSHVSMYLELGWVPIKYLIKSRRLMYLKYVLNENEHSMINMFLQAQLARPLRGDFVLLVKEDLCDLKLEYYSIEQIKNLSKDQFRSLVNEAVNKMAFKELIEKKNLQSKIKHINYNGLRMQKYLKSNQITNNDAILILILIQEGI